MKVLLTALAFVVAAAAQNAVQLPSVYQAQNPSPNAPGGYCQTQSPPTYNYATNTLFSCVPNTTPPTDRGTWTPSTFAVLPQLVTVAPSGACTGQGLQYVKPGGTIYTCQSGTWLQLAGTGAVSAVTASAPFTSSGGSAPNISATVQGNGSKVQLSTGTTTTNDCVKFDANGNTVDAGAACGSGAGGITALTGDVTASGTGSVAATVVKVNGVSITGTPSSGQVPTATSSTTATWQAPTVASTLPFAVSFATNVVTSGISNPSGFIGVLPGNGPPVVTGVATLTITSGTGTIFEYISGGTGGTTLGTHTFAHNITTTSCANCTAVSGTAFPIDSFPIRTITVTSGTASLLASYVTGSYSWQPLLPGSNVALTPSNGSITISASMPVTHGIGYSFDGGGSALTSGLKKYVTVPFGCTITGWNIAVDTGTATVDIWKIATGTAIPTITNTITASAVPAISTGTAIHSATLTGWTTTVTANDIFGFNLSAVSSATYVNIMLGCQ